MGTTDFSLCWRYTSEARMVGETEYYEFFGVAPDATDDQITLAYRKLAKKFHPDKNPEAGDKDKEMTDGGEEGGGGCSGCCCGAKAYIEKFGFAAYAPMTGQPMAMNGQPMGMNGQPMNIVRPINGQPMNVRPMYGNPRPMYGNPRAMYGNPRPMT